MAVPIAWLINPYPQQSMLMNFTTYQQLCKQKHPPVQEGVLL